MTEITELEYQKRAAWGDLNELTSRAHENGTAVHARDYIDYAGRESVALERCRCSTYCDEAEAMVLIPYAWVGYGADMTCKANVRYLRENYRNDDYVVPFEDGYAVDVRKVTDANVREAVGLLENEEGVFDWGTYDDLVADELWEYFDLGFMRHGTPDEVTADHLMDAVRELEREGEDPYTVDGDSVYVWEEREADIVRRACQIAGVEYLGEDD